MVCLGEMGIEEIIVDCLVGIEGEEDIGGIVVVGKEVGVIGIFDGMEGI